VSPQCGHQPVRLWRSGTGADAVLRLLRAIRSEVCHFQSANLCNFHSLLTPFTNFGRCSREIGSGMQMEPLRTGRVGSKLANSLAESDSESAIRTMFSSGA